MIKRLVFVGIVVAILALLSGGVWWLFSSGHLIYSASGQSSAAVCNADIVNTYNAAMYYQPRNDATESSIDQQGVKDLVSEIRTKSNFDGDPTCQTIIFWSAVLDDNYSEARTAYDAIMNLYEKRVFADSNLRSDQALFTYEQVMNGLTGSGIIEDGTFGG